MDDKKELPERFPCSGCAFSYTVGRGKGEYKGQQVIRKHNSRTGPGLCSGAGKPPRTEEQQAEIERLSEDAFSSPAHVHDYQYGDDGNGHSGSFCIVCGPDPCEEEPDECACGGTDYDCPNGCGGDGADEDETEPQRQLRLAGAYDNPGPRGHERPLLAVAARAMAKSVAVATGLTELVDSIAASTLAQEPVPSVAHLFTDLSGVTWSHPGDREACVLPECVLSRPSDLSHTTKDERAELHRQSVQAIADADQLHVRPSVPDAFQAPAPAPVPEPAVSGQPEPERDRWGRYMLPLGKGGKLVGTTRATTFAKSTSDTFNLSQWGDRMVVRGLTLRPDLVALAHGLDVKRDRDALNSIAEQAKEAAGNKVAANLGTALHSFSERLDAGLMGTLEVPAPYRRQMELYAETVMRSGLTSRPEWIERTTAVTVQGTRPGVVEEVAGTLDRIFQLPNGDLVIGDLKTGADLTYGWGEIAVQLAVYARGVNQRGLFDHRTKTWEAVGIPGPVLGKITPSVRTDFAIVMHLPADPTEGGKYPGRQPSCELYWVDLREGWEAAGLNADVRSWRKTKNLARPLHRDDIETGGIWNPQEGTLVEPGTTYQVEQIKDQPSPATVQVSEAAASHLHSAIAQANEALENAREAQARWELAEKHFRSATSREALKQLWQYATDCGHFSEDQVSRLTAIGMEQLNLLEPSPS